MTGACKGVARNAPTGTKKQNYQQKKTKNHEKPNQLR